MLPATISSANFCCLGFNCSTWNSQYRLDKGISSTLFSEAFRGACESPPSLFPGFLDPFTSFLIGQFRPRRETGAMNRWMIARVLQIQGLCGAYLSRGDYHSPLPPSSMKAPMAKLFSLNASLLQVAEIPSNYTHGLQSRSVELPASLLPPHRARLAVRWLLQL